MVVFQPLAQWQFCTVALSTAVASTLTAGTAAVTVVWVSTVSVRTEALMTARRSNAELLLAWPPLMANRRHLA